LQLHGRLLMAVTKPASGAAPLWCCRAA
jgi:hypothetical protein